MLRRFALILLLGSVAMLSRAATDDHAVPRARLPLLTTAPIIDGVIGDDEWAGCLRVVGFCGVRSPLLVGGDASFWVGCDGTRLFIAVRSETPPGGELLTRVEPAPGDGDARVWLDDSVELVLDPLRTAPEARRRLYHAILNAKGAIYDQRHTVKGGGEAWRGQWQLASTVKDDRWHFECAIPLADLGVTAADLAQPFGVRVCRNWQRTAGPAQSEWAPAGEAFLNPDTMPELVWDAAAPVVQQLQLHDPGSTAPRLLLAVRNPHAQPLPVQVDLRLRPRSSAPAELSQAYTLAPGATQLVELTAGMAQGDQAFLDLRVTSPDGAQTYFQRDCRWQPERPEPFFLLAAGDAKRLAFDFAHYPYHQTIHARLDFSALRERDQVTGVGLTLRAKGGAPLAETTMPPATAYRTELLWPIAALADGEYELVVTLRGVTAEPYVVSFVRRVFPWEHNTIGMSDVLIPPYTPIAIAGAQVSTILRRHTVGAAGLWDQVESLDQPLLRGPMRLEATSGGQRHLATGPAPAWQEQRPTRAVASGPFQAGPLTGSVTTTWDYDGVMAWTLRLEPGAAPLEALTLTIPLANADSPLMHACTDGIRFNYAGAVPPGEGRVWASSQAARNSLLGSYVPYLWVGAEERGLCVFGENDRGWVTAPEVPCQELVREGDTLNLVLHLVAAPVALTEARTLTIGFQATPVKPMPPDWRRWVFSAWRAMPLPGLARRIGFLGSCWYWGTDTPCLDWYPRDQDMGYLRQLAETRRTGQVDQEFITRWLAGFERHYAAAKTPEKRLEIETIFRNHTNGAFHLMKGKPEIVCFYTNGRGVRFDTPEGQTFLDEWHRDAFPPRAWDFAGGVAYDLDPTASFRDYALWYLREMSAITMDSVYWDDLFLQSTFDLMGSEAYRLPSGHIQPSTGLWNLREFVRRTAVMYLEQQRPAQNIVHMTNTALTPVLSFAQMNYSLEDKAGGADWQDRYSRDYLRAEAIGRQQGNVPFALWLIREPDPQRLAFVERTGTGCLLVHEIKTSGVADIFWQTYRRLLEFGYGLPEVTVSQYWRRDHPAKVAGSDAATLVLGKPGEALVLVVDYGDGGDVALTLDRSALGLAGELTATELESGTALAVADATVRFPLPRHDFRLIHVRAAGR